MKRLFSRLRASPLMLALLSLGVPALPRMRTVRIPVSPPVTQATASRRRPNGGWRGDGVR